MTWPVLADELDALARRLQRMSLARSEQAYETRSEIVHEIRKAARRIRQAAATKVQPACNPPATKTATKTPTIQPGTITDRNGNIIPISFKRRRGTGRSVPKGYR